MDRKKREKVTLSIMRPISVNKAISRGQLTVTLPSALLLFGAIGSSLYLSITKHIPTWGVILGLILGLIISWLYWSYFITKWKLWAFHNVRNVHELKRKAIEQGLIWKDSSWFTKTEIKTKQDKLDWQNLQSKFKRKDEYLENKSLPHATIIKYSKFKNGVQLGIMLLCLVLGIHLLMTTHHLAKGLLLTLVGAFFAFKELKQVLNNKVQLIIDAKGIKGDSIEFKSWRLIKNEATIIERNGKNHYTYLVYDHDSGSEKIDVSDFNVSRKQLENALKTYRIRSKKCF